MKAQELKISHYSVTIQQVMHVHLVTSTYARCHWPPKRICCYEVVMQYIAAAGIAALTFVNRSYL